MTTCINAYWFVAHNYRQNTTKQKLLLWSSYFACHFVTISYFLNCRLFYFVESNQNECNAIKHIYCLFGCFTSSVAFSGRSIDHLHRSIVERSSHRELNVIES